MTKRKILHCSASDGDYVATDGGTLFVSIGYGSIFGDKELVHKTLTPTEARILASRLVELADEIERSK